MQGIAALPCREVGGGQWIHAHSLICHGFESDTPSRVPPGGTFTSKLSIFYTRVPNSQTGFELEEFSGTYRLVYRIDRRAGSDWQANRGLTGPLPKEQRVSNPFRLIDPTQEGATETDGMERRPPAGAVRGIG